MRKRFARIRRNGLRWFLMIWVTGTWLIFALLVGGMLLATFQLHRQNGELQQENEHLLTNVMLELEILSLRREVAMRKQLPESAFAAADQYEEQLVRDANSSEKQTLSLQVVDQYGQFKKNALAGIRKGQFELGESMYSNLQLLRGINTNQLQATREAAGRISQLSRWWGIGILAAAGLLLLWGSLELWLRIFNPIIALSRTARAIANGHMNVRAPVLREDELGSLSETFNVMADAMVERENERMHFVATVAHDLKNPLVVIGGLAQLLNHKGERATAQEREEWLQLIVLNTRKLEENIAELADAAQASTGKVQLNLQEVNMGELVENVVAECSESLDDHPLKCELHDVPAIEADPKKIERVVLNLLSNASKYSPPESEISVQLHCNRKWVNLHISDKGAGMAHEDIKKAFIPFVRLEHTQSMAKGTGLGLLSVKKIVEAHGGRIRMRSKLGKGTRIVIMLPRRRRSR